MLNLKKGLALVLAAATAFTFAPVANLGNAVEAKAETAFTAAQSIGLTVDEEITYSVDIANVADGTKYNISNSDPTVVEVKYSTAANQANPTTTAGAALVKDSLYNHGVIKVKALKAGTSTLHIEYYESNKAWVTKDIVFTVSNKSNVPAWEIQGYTKHTTKGVIDSYGYEATNTANDYTLYLPGSAPDGTQYSYAADAVSSSDTSVVDVTTKTTASTQNAENNSTKLQLKKKGTATITVKATAYGTGATKLTGDQTFTFVLNVIANGSTLKVGGNTIAASVSRTPSYTGSPKAWTNVDQTIYLTAAKPSEKINASLDDPQSTAEKIAYTAYTSSAAPATAETYSDTTKTNDIEVAADGTVTATAKALNASEQYYFVKVSNSLSGANEKDGWVRVITSRTDKAFTNLKVTVDGKDKTATAKFDAAGNVTDDTDKTIDVAMSTQDKTNVPFTVESSNQYDVKSNDASTVDVVNGALVAKRVGVASVTISTKSDTTHYGAAAITIRVNVTNQKLNAKVVADKDAITLTKITKSAKIAARVVTTPALTSQPVLTYQFVTRKADGTYEKATPADFTLSADGTVTYTTTAEASAIVQVSAASTNDYATPAPAYVTVTGTQKKAATKLNVTTKALNLVAGETGSVVASGTALSYTSSDTDVATVDASGVVTAVKPGVTVITVADAGNDEFAAGSENVTVYVKASYNDPKKVTGVKVSNKKGAKVTVTFTKDTTNPNMKYYVQKKVGKKTSGKSVGSNKATLSVKKGATVKVRVKAYYYDAEGTKHVGAWSSWKTFKTDKK